MLRAMAAGVLIDPARNVHPLRSTAAGKQNHLYTSKPCVERAMPLIHGPPKNASLHRMFGIFAPRGLRAYSLFEKYFDMKYQEQVFFLNQDRVSNKRWKHEVS